MKRISISKNILNENSDILQSFFRDLNNYKIYSGDEQIQLAKEALAGNEQSKEKLINSNLKFVVTCAKKYVGQGVPLMDLISAGTIGLLNSLKNFDPDRGYKFLSFAVWYIRKEILKEIYNNGRTIRYPITYISNTSKVRKARENFISEHDREPTEDELLDMVDISEKQLLSVLNNKSYCQSYDTPISEDGSVTLADTIADDSNSDNFISDAVSKTLKCLSKREYKVISEFYGLEGNEETPIKDIAVEMDLGEERVRQLRKSGVKKLKAKFGTTLKTLL